MDCTYVFLRLPRPFVSSEVETLHAALGVSTSLDTNGWGRVMLVVPTEGISR